MTTQPRRERPTMYDGTQYVIYLDLPPDRQLKKADVYEYVYGIRLDDGAKPWPYYRDASTKKWWSLGSPTDVEIDSLVWMIDLQQLSYRPRDDAEQYLEEVLSELAARAEELGAVAAPECSVGAALEKMGRVVRMLRIRDYTVRILVAAPKGSFYSVAEWWEALEGVGLTYGDGNLFWLLNESFSEDGSEPYELFHAEPYSQPGYFHSGDLHSPVRFPDVALSFRARTVSQPIAVLRCMAAIAQELADRLGATLLTGNGDPFHLASAESRLEHALAEIEVLQNTT